ncbi:ATP-grasp domain-containing protein [Methyloligella sp. 2.7D]|uniref:ATP-grasp domain-containing protein n=1 Tax=unclassified Methyloligella TaxID=2625955 RepID=UPI00157CFDB6|nr:ATP-grasp domain-containing protein [Methyloligella sp. GL2]QKP77777.1 ATP-grasp domain-containing protein [Methyloligella sp. GL2]
MPLKDASVLIASVSARSLAAAARAAGLVPLTADFFADRDTQELAAASLKLPGSLSVGFTEAPLMEALQQLADKAPSPVQGVIYGSGFEDKPELLRRISERWPLLGNDADTVDAINSPDIFFGALEALHIPHPETSLTPPPDPEGWLAKRIGGAGGSHVVWAGSAHGSHGLYYQRKITGRPVSCLFVGNGEEARILGFSMQWAASTSGRLWRYGGAAQPAELDAPIKDAMSGWVAQLVSHFGLQGLGSADFLVDREDAQLLEINPRPGATLDIFAATEAPLLSFHLDAVTTRKLPSLPVPPGAAASAIVFAPRALTIPPDFDWPPYAADLPKPGERIEQDRPICTVQADGSDAEAARRLAEKRVSSILAALAAP